MKSIMPDFPEEGMHIDDVIDLMMRSGGTKDKALTIIRFADDLKEYGKNDDFQKLIDLAGQMSKAKGTDDIRKIYKESLTIFIDGIFEVNREIEKKERFKRLKKQKSFRKRFKKSKKKKK
jgi:hypothetical protein